VIDAARDVEGDHVAAIEDLAEHADLDRAVALLNGRERPHVRNDGREILVAQPVEFVRGHEAHRPAVPFDAVSQQTHELAVRIRRTEPSRGDVGRRELAERSDLDGPTAPEIRAVTITHRAGRERFGDVFAACDDERIGRARDVRDRHVVHLVGTRCEGAHLEPDEQSAADDDGPENGAGSYENLFDEWLHDEPPNLLARRSAE